MDVICVKTGLLCPRCQALVDSGQVSKDEIPVMKSLVELEENQGQRLLKNAKYKKSIWLRRMLVIVLSLPNAGLPELKRLSRQLSDAMGTRVQVVSFTRDVKMLAAQLVAPARVLGVNMVWLPDGTTQYVVRLSRFDQRVLPDKPEELEKALQEILGVPVRVRVE